MLKTCTCMHCCPAAHSSWCSPKDNIACLFRSGSFVSETTACKQDLCSCITFLLECLIERDSMPIWLSVHQDAIAIEEQRIRPA